jgi:hypothetical protein
MVKEDAAPAGLYSSPSGWERMPKAGEGFSFFGFGSTKMPRRRRWGRTPCQNHFALDVWSAPALDKHNFPNDYFFDATPNSSIGTDAVRIRHRILASGGIGWFEYAPIHCESRTQTVKIAHHTARASSTFLALRNPFTNKNGTVYDNYNKHCPNKRCL